MAKRALRIVKNLGRIPAVAACTVCAKTFEAPLGALVSVKDAEAASSSSFTGTSATEKMFGSKDSFECGEINDANPIQIFPRIFQLSSNEDASSEIVSKSLRPKTRGRYTSPETVINQLDKACTNSVNTKVTKVQ